MPATLSPLTSSSLRSRELFLAVCLLRRRSLLTSLSLDQLADPHPGLQHVARHGASLAPTIEADSCAAVLVEAGEAAKKHHRPLRRVVLPQLRNLPRPHHREPTLVLLRSPKFLTNHQSPAAGSRHTPRHHRPRRVWHQPLSDAETLLFHMPLLEYSRPSFRLVSRPNRHSSIAWCLLTSLLSSLMRRQIPTLHATQCT